MAQPPPRDRAATHQTGASDGDTPRQAACCAANETLAAAPADSWRRSALRAPASAPRPAPASPALRSETPAPRSPVAVHPARAASPPVPTIAPPPARPVRAPVARGDVAARAGRRLARPDE